MDRQGPRRGGDPQFHAQGRNHMEGRKAELGLTEAQQADVRDFFDFDDGDDFEAIHRDIREDIRL